MNKNSLSILLLTGFGLGYLRPAPGTWGSLLPVLLVVVLIAVSPTALLYVNINIALAITAVAFVLICLLLGRSGEAQLGSKDPPQIVADEVAGQSLVLWFLPWRNLSQPHAWWWNLNVAAVALISFRVLDIVKPQPARAVQQLPHGRGIVLDDLIAAVYAMIVTQLCVRNFWPIP